MKKNHTAVLVFLICFLGGCSPSQPLETLSVSNNDVQLTFEETSEEQTDNTEASGELPTLIDISKLQPPDLRKISIAKNMGSYCPREDYPSLYEDVEALVTRRNKVLNSLVGIDYNTQLNWDEYITDEKGGKYYLFKEDRSLADVRADLASIYTDNYINTSGAWYLTHLFREENGKLYRSGGDGWVDSLYDDWVLEQINDESYYIIGYRAMGAWDYGECPVIEFWIITQTEEGFRISDENAIFFSQTLYILPEDAYKYDSEMD